MCINAQPKFVGRVLPRTYFWVLLVGLSLTTNLLGQEKKTWFRFPLPSSGPRSMDPADGQSLYDGRAMAQVYEPLLEYAYLKRPYQVRPLLLESMPVPSQDGLVYTFTLKKGVHFHDHDCFPEGKGRELVATDVIYSLKRIADPSVSENSWWLLKEMIVGLDEFRKTQINRGRFDYDDDVAGLTVLDKYRFSIKLTKPSPRILMRLAAFQTGIVPREAVESLGQKFSEESVGTGPYRLQKGHWLYGRGMKLTRNENYHGVLRAEDIIPGTNLKPGTQLPLVDEIHVPFFSAEDAMWARFGDSKIDFTNIPAGRLSTVLTNDGDLVEPLSDVGIGLETQVLLDFIFFGFNMEHEVVGGYEDKKKWLRQAMSLAVDWQRRNTLFYDGRAFIYDGPIPPGLVGFPKSGKAKASFRGPDLERAKQLLAKAGYPGGKGLPTIEYHTSISGPGKEMAQQFAYDLQKIGVTIEPKLHHFSNFMEVVNQKKAPMFSFAWASDYPDPENNFQLFYGPFEAPGANHFNYKNAEFDKRYEKMFTLSASPERTKLCNEMRQILIGDAPFIGSMARVRHTLRSPAVENCRTTTAFSNWLKYVQIQPEKRLK